MRRYGAPGLSSAQRVDMWCRWRAGYPIAQIARTFGRDHGSIGSLLPRRPIEDQESTSQIRLLGFASLNRELHWFN